MFQEYVLAERDPTQNTDWWTDTRIGGQPLECLERLSTVRCKSNSRVGLRKEVNYSMTIPRLVNDRFD